MIPDSCTRGPPRASPASVPSTSYPARAIPDRMTRDGPDGARAPSHRFSDARSASPRRPARPASAGMTSVSKASLADSVTTKRHPTRDNGPAAAPSVRRRTNGAGDPRMRRTRSEWTSASAKPRPAGRPGSGRTPVRRPLRGRFPSPRRLLRAGLRPRPPIRRRRPPRPLPGPRPREGCGRVRSPPATTTRRPAPNSSAR